MFGYLNKRTTATTILDGLQKGSKFAEVAGNLLNQALVGNTWVNPVTIFIIDQVTSMIFQLPVNPLEIKNAMAKKNPNSKYS